MNKGWEVLPNCTGNLREKGVSFLIRKLGHVCYNLPLCLVREGSKDWLTQKEQCVWGNTQSRMLSWQKPAERSTGRNWLIYIKFGCTTRMEFSELRFTIENCQFCGGRGKKACQIIHRRRWDDFVLWAEPNYAYVQQFEMSQILELYISDLQTSKCSNDASHYLSTSKSDFLVKKWITW